MNKEMLFDFLLIAGITILSSVVFLGIAKSVHTSIVEDAVKYGAQTGAELAIISIQSNNTNVTFDIVRKTALELYNERNKR